ncbi:putative lipid carrier protein YhbT [Breoghania corrubedonensis]|uniref:Putative lipid carrier protein YhbT n=1 Tax=Breoghania corrubedonensis TaxID=665038 RepID=A0A2T5VB78_9HYPH|nr:SCP2 sterol-binding domain-containing protein [Breoghania corrubedonensis]PTW61004.1 putative lipid carrier protein YhbT [Breoghania corrubedonensis]
MLEHQSPELPRPARLLAAALPSWPLEMVLTRALRALADRRPELFERLGVHSRCVFVVRPTDLDFAFSVVPHRWQGRVSVVRPETRGDVHIEGPLLRLLGLLDGSLDGDALFFNRVISVSGRTDALLALRNAIEEAELAPSDLLGVSGRVGRFADAAILRAIQALQGMAEPAANATPGAL